MSVFEKMFSGLGAAALSNLGLGDDGWTYTPPTGGGSNVSNLTIQIERSEPMEVSGKIIDSDIQTANIVVAQSALPKPQKGGRFSKGDRTWTIAIFPVEANGQFYCTCTRSGVNRLAPQRSA